MVGNETPTPFRSMSLFHFALRALLGGTIAAGMAVLGLLLSAGGTRFALAFALVAGLVLAIIHNLGRNWVEAGLKFTGRVGLLATTGTLGVAGGFILLSDRGRAETIGLGSSGHIVIYSSLILTTAIWGSSAAAHPGRIWSWHKAWRILVSIVGAGVVVGWGLHYWVDWSHLKYLVWGIASGAGLGASLAWLSWARKVESEDAHVMPRLENTLLFLSIFILLINGAMPYAWNDTGYFNLHTHQARAFLAGRLDIDVPENTITDVIYFDSKKYVPLLPSPALLLMPMVWLLNSMGVSSVPMRVISAVIGALSAVMLNRIFEKLGIQSSHRLWIIVAFVFGTGFWFTTLRTDDSGGNFSHDVAVLGMLLAVNEALGRGRGPLAGLYLGMATISRPTTIFAAVFLVVALMHYHYARRNRSHLRVALNLVGLGGTLILWLGGYLAFNYFRFGNPFDTGFTAYLSPTGHFTWVRYQELGSFDVVFLWSNLYYTFLHGFNIQFAGDDLLAPIGMDPFGTSLTIASPFLFLAFFADWNRKLLWGAWTSIGLIFAVHMFYFTNGYHQINTQRYVLDYLPLLILLVALGARRTRSGVLEFLTLYATGLNLIALFIVPSSL